VAKARFFLAVYGTTQATPATKICHWDPGKSCPFKEAANQGTTQEVDLATTSKDASSVGVVLEKVAVREMAPV